MSLPSVNRYVSPVLKAAYTVEKFRAHIKGRLEYGELLFSGSQHVVDEQDGNPRHLALVHRE